MQSEVFFTDKLTNYILCTGKCQACYIRDYEWCLFKALYLHSALANVMYIDL